MTRRLFHRVLLGLTLVVANGSFATPVEPAPRPLQAKSSMRITRHLAAGLEYLLVEPRDVAPDAELPLIVVLHGRGSQPEPPVGPYLDLDVPVRVILPRGPLRSGDAYSWMPVSAHGGESRALNDALRDRMTELNEAIGIWRDRHPTRGLPILTGFSQGGILTATFALTHPESVYRAFPISGWVPTSLAPRTFDAFERHVPIHELHGADDAVIGAGRTRDQAAALRELGYPIVYEAIEGAGHEMHPEMLERLREEILRALREQPEATDAAGLS
ncbi:MAG: hypothetical protein H6719_06400 [Sandaracinaceae bacterium]|nr:hypothetical protein [Sandaracinaceae bacterium]